MNNTLRSKVFMTMTLIFFLEGVKLRFGKLSKPLIGLLIQSKTNGMSQIIFFHD